MGIRPRRHIRRLWCGAAGSGRGDAARRSPRACGPAWASPACGVALQIGSRGARGAPARGSCGGRRARASGAASRAHRAHCGNGTHPTPYITAYYTGAARIVTASSAGWSKRQAWAGGARPPRAFPAPPHRHRKASHQSSRQYLRACVVDCGSEWMEWGGPLRRRMGKVAAGSQAAIERGLASWQRCARAGSSCTASFQAAASSSSASAGADGCG